MQRHDPWFTAGVRWGALGWHAESTQAHFLFRVCPMHAQRICALLSCGCNLAVALTAFLAEKSIHMVDMTQSPVRQHEQEGRLRDLFSCQCGAHCAVSRQQTGLFLRSTEDILLTAPV